jgi:hypothetical protein
MCVPEKNICSALEPFAGQSIQQLPQHGGLITILTLSGRSRSGISTPRFGWDQQALPRALE